MGLNIMDINVFYSTFTNVFFIFVAFFTFFNVFLFFITFFASMHIVGSSYSDLVAS